MRIAPKLFFYILLFLCSFTSYAQDWIKTDVTNFASIEFPVESEQLQAQGQTIYTAEDKLAYYVVSIRPFSEAQSAQITPRDYPTLYQGAAQGAADAANAEIIAMNEIKWKQLPAMELVYKAPANAMASGLRFKRIVYVNNTLITADFWPMTALEDQWEEQKNTFFNSLSVGTITNPEPAQLLKEETTTPTTAYDYGFTVGRVVGFLIPIGLVIGIILLIRYSRKKKKSKHSEIKEEVAATPTKKLCSNCHTENKGDAKYCSGCGFALTAK